MPAFAFALTVTLLVLVVFTVSCASGFAPGGINFGTAQYKKSQGDRGYARMHGWYIMHAN